MQLKKYLSRITSVVIVSFLILMLYAVVSSKLSGGPANAFGYQLKTVLSGSMEPVIHTGSVIAIKPVTDKMEFKQGDIITYQSIDDHDMLFTHRIMETHNENGKLSFTTKGDANDSNDTVPVPEEHIIGVYTGFMIPFVGYVVTFAQSQLGSLLFLALPGILIMIFAFRSMWKAITELETNRAKKEA